MKNIELTVMQEKSPYIHIYSSNVKGFMFFTFIVTNENYFQNKFNIN